MEKLRTKLILDYLRKKRSCTIEELRSRFKVSSATIHRDVQELCSRDAIERVRGGLVYNDAPVITRSAADFSERVVANRSAKIAAAEQALKLIREGDIIFLDSSTTVYELASLLRNSPIEHLTIVTNSIAVMQLFRKYPTTWVLIALGGNFDPQLNSILGAAALSQLENFNVTRAFVSAFGLDDKSATTNHERQAEIIRTVLDTANHRYLLIDKTKLDRTGLYRFWGKGGFDKVLIG